MSKLIAIGEMLIDFTGTQHGNIDNTSTFEKNPGGAPANVALCVAKYGASAALITKLGQDAFGDFLLKTLKQGNVDVSQVKRTDKANTPLAFVSLDSDGEREFVFYRNPSSDLLLSASEINRAFFSSGDILHFCSVCLSDYPVLEAHRTAIEYCTAAGGIISFDPNLRYSLWDKDKLISRVREFLPCANIIKLSEDELRDISGIINEYEAVKSILSKNTEIVLITRGENGASLYLKDLTRIDSQGYKALQIDATGAGDTFIGTFLYQVLHSGGLEGLDTDKLLQFLRFSNKAAALCVSRRGAVPALPLYREVFDD